MPTQPTQNQEQKLFVCEDGWAHKIMDNRGGQFCQKCSKYLNDLVEAHTRQQVAAALQKAPSNTSDGYHTFSELYEYRMLLQAAWFNQLYREYLNHDCIGIKPLKSWRHHDGELCFGKENYFVVVAQLPTGQVSNHYKGEHWDLFNIPEVERAPKWDGHSPKEAADRIRATLTQSTPKDTE